MGLLGEQASRLRWRKELAKAHRIAERMLALAKHFVATYPDEHLPQLMAAIAHVQLSKDARENQDDRALKDNLTLALEAAQVASRLDPSSEAAQQQVSNIQRKLAGLHPKR
jgi:hypothetical protein